jgi:hypothetical protein
MFSRRQSSAIELSPRRPSSTMRIFSSAEYWSPSGCRGQASRPQQGWGLTTAHILYRMPDHPSLLQAYVWQNYDLFPKFPALQDFLAFWQKKARRSALLGDRGAFPAD